MRIIISPAKKMNVDSDSLACEGVSVFIHDTEKILYWLQNLTFDELKKLWNCNEKIAKITFERIQNMDLYSNLTPAIISYEGIQYNYMSPSVFEFGQFDYVQEHLRILSGFYGVLKPMDGVTPYRLEMQAKAKIANTKDLYEYWGSRLYQNVRDEDGVFINLASKEYSKCIEQYLTPQDTYITCVFGEMVDGKIVQKGTYAKMARGEMVRFMAENGIKNPEEMKQFDRLGYRFRNDLSSNTEYVFERIKSEEETP